ncbi:hypothetical protein Sinac_6251 [Singulisphaera acidiphila DSM 18658]|uniref:Uncharacterized protein n=1 Tax=Singulisphaera acidiphila (strain ATCC BAA-1392 / DSM 18658 / VKM B-2454 / MOB10) TaxID=886293 RepID=L0DLT6_SINAD|nr:hypothetical protein Sinac_6251 [Singulisphaera acidiphila DSM 18658]
MTGKRSPVTIHLILASLMCLSLVGATTAPIDTPIVLSDSEQSVLGKDSMKYNCEASCTESTGGLTQCYPPAGFAGCSASGMNCGEVRFNPQSFSHCANDPFGPKTSCSNSEGQTACYGTIPCVCDWSWLTISYSCHASGTIQDGGMAYSSGDCN